MKKTFNVVVLFLISTFIFAQEIVIPSFNGRVLSSSSITDQVFAYTPEEIAGISNSLDQLSRFGLYPETLNTIMDDHPAKSFVEYWICTFLNTTSNYNEMKEAGNFWIIFASSDGQNWFFIRADEKSDSNGSLNRWNFYTYYYKSERPVQIIQIFNWVNNFNT